MGPLEYRYPPPPPPLVSPPFLVCFSFFGALGFRPGCGGKKFCEEKYFVKKICEESFVKKNKMTTHGVDKKRLRQLTLPIRECEILPASTSASADTRKTG